MTVSAPPMVCIRPLLHLHGRRQQCARNGMKRRFWHVGRRSLPKIALAENRGSLASNFVSFRFDAPDVPYGGENDGAICAPPQSNNELVAYAHRYGRSQ